MSFCFTNRDSWPSISCGGSGGGGGDGGGARDGGGDAGLGMPHAYQYSVLFHLVSFCPSARKQARVFRARLSQRECRVRSAGIQ